MKDAHSSGHTDAQDEEDQPVAWSFEWFGDMDEGPTRWHKCLSHDRPSEVAGGQKYRNIRPLKFADEPAFEGCRVESMGTQRPSRYPKELVAKAKYEMNVWDRVAADTGGELIAEVEWLRAEIERLAMPVAAFEAGEDVKIVACGQRDGSTLWAVRHQDGSVLAKDGQWWPEPLPSSRDADFLVRFRFATPNEARDAYLRA